MKVRKLVALLLVSAGTLGVPATAQAVLLPVAGWGYSVGYGIARGIGLDEEGECWIGWWDPPMDVISGRFTVGYNPALITIRPDLSGYVGPFSASGLDIPYEPSGVYPAFDVAGLGAARAGAVTSILVGPDTVTVEFDFSANPAAVESDEHTNIFGLVFTTSRPLRGFEFVPRGTGDIGLRGSPEDQAANGTDAATYLLCADGYCGMEPMGDLRGVAVPEPATAALAAVGGLALAAASRRGRRDRVSGAAGKG